MLHDLAKVIELTGPDNTGYTVRGNLIGHISLIDEEITKVLMELGIDDSLEEVIVLRHVILATTASWSMEALSVRRLWEAEILHMIDNIDAGNDDDAVGLG